MTVNRRKKSVRHRGSKTHGCGSMKKRRGAGHRGGRGRAGSGKRGDAKKPSFDTSKFGKHGFYHPHKKVVTINLRELEDVAETNIKKGLFANTSGVIECDLAKIGVNKLLGSGKLAKKWKITVAQASARALEKVQANGGEVTTSAPAAAESAE